MKKETLKVPASQALRAAALVSTVMPKPQEPIEPSIEMSDVRQIAALSAGLRHRSNKRG